MQSHPGSKPVLYLLPFKQNILEGDLVVHLRVGRIVWHLHEVGVSMAKLRRLGSLE
jgi:hypothetical protein